jgi:Lar family restriction alleviation protein
MDTKQIKPCPFCGSSASLNSDHVDFFVMCDTCSGKGPRLQSPTGNHEASKRGAVEAWNKRAAIAPSDAAQAPTYQNKLKRADSWCDCDKETFDHTAAHPSRFDTRILYACPVAPGAAAPTEAVSIDGVEEFLQKCASECQRLSQIDADMNYWGASLCLLDAAEILRDMPEVTAHPTETRVSESAKSTNKSATCRPFQ